MVLLSFNVQPLSKTYITMETFNYLFELQLVTLRVIKQKLSDGEQRYKLWFMANPFAKALGYIKPNDIVRKHVTNTEYKSIRELLPDCQLLHPQSTFVTVAGLRELLNTSRMPKAYFMRKWFDNTVLPEIKSIVLGKINNVNQEDVNREDFNDDVVPRKIHAMSFTYSDVYFNLNTFTYGDELWFSVKPFAKMLGFSGHNKEVYEVVSRCNYKYTQKSADSTRNSLFVNVPGLRELINASQIPHVAKQMEEWLNNRFIDMVNGVNDYQMYEEEKRLQELRNREERAALADNSIPDADNLNHEVFTFNGNILQFATLDQDGQKWYEAEPFAVMVEKDEDALRMLISKPEDMTCMKGNINMLTRAYNLRKITPKTLFVNERGLLEFLTKSACDEFKQFVASNVLATPMEQQEEECNTPMEQEESTGVDVQNLENIITEKDEIIKQKEKLLQQKNESLDEIVKQKVESFNEIMKQKEELIKQKDDSLLKANESILKLAERVTTICERMTSIAADVVVKPADPKLLHGLVVCQVGKNEFAFLRRQRRSLDKSLKTLRKNKSKLDVIFQKDYVPNPINVLNKVKEQIPKNMRVSKSNTLKLLGDFSKNDLLELIKKSVTSDQLKLDIVNND